MGSSSSKAESNDDQVEDKFTEFTQRVRTNVEDEFAKKAMMQREVQMAINLSKARDNLQIFGSLWLTFVSGVAVARVAGKPVPGVMSVPIVVGAVFLGNLAGKSSGGKFGCWQQRRFHLLTQESCLLL